MSYIANLVGRTLGVGRLAQPVIQTKFAPQSPSIAMAGSAAPVLNRIPAVRQDPATPLASLDQARAARGAARGVPSGPVSAHSEPEAPDHASNVPMFSPREFVPSTAGSPESRTPVTPAPHVHEAKAETDDVFHLMPGSTQAGDEFPLMRDGFASSAMPGLRPASVARPYPSGPESTAAPVVRVHIGRVDVRMVQQSAKDSRAASPTLSETRPASLEEYLGARQRGQR